MLHLIERIYSAAEDPALWPEFLADYSEFVGASMAAIFVQHVSAPIANIAASVRWDPHYMNLFKEHYAQVNPFMLLNQGRMKTGDVKPGQATIADRALESTEFYNDYMLPQRFHHELGSVLAYTDETSAHLTALRPKSAGQFEQREIRALELLVPHLQRALRLNRLCAELRSARDGAAGALDSATVAAFVLDSRGEVLSMNTFAARLVRQHSGLEYRQGRLCATVASENASLWRCVDAALQAQEGAGGTASTRTLIQGSGESPLQVVVSPVRPNQMSLFGPCAAVVVVVTDPDQERRSAVARLIAEYGITRAEGRLVDALSKGRTVKQAAIEDGISFHTAREYLKRVFKKTGSNRQSELIRLLSSC